MSVYNHFVNIITVLLQLFGSLVHEIRTDGKALQTSNLCAT